MSNLLHQASLELETLRRDGPAHFPLACRRLVAEQCLDCGAPNAQWASVTFGATLCLNCSGRHRSYGVQHSKVRSLDMDHWTHTQVLNMLEGGNAQVTQFFGNHLLNDCKTRYRTKAARFYARHLQAHAELVANAGVYQGREYSRKLACSKRRKSMVVPQKTAVVVQC